MGPVRNGVQWTSRVISWTRTPALFAAPALSLSIVPGPTPADAATDYLLVSRSSLRARPVTGTLQSFDLPGEADRLRSQADAQIPKSSA
jgi:hypothetical protein